MQNAMNFKMFAPKKKNNPTPENRHMSNRS